MDEKTNWMSFSLDLIVTEELVEQFINQLYELEDKAVWVDSLERKFSGDQSKDFYEGLLAGYMASHSIAQQENTIGELLPKLGLIVAFIATKVSDLRAE